MPKKKKNEDGLELLQTLANNYILSCEKIKNFVFIHQITPWYPFSCQLMKGRLLGIFKGMGSRERNTCHQISALPLSG